MTKNNTELINSHVHWMMILNTLVNTLEERKQHFNDEMPHDVYIEMLDQFIDKLKLPNIIATFFATTLNAESTDKLLEELKSIQIDLHDDYNEVAPLPSTKALNSQEEIDAFLDEILEKKKKQAQRLFANKNKMIVEEFEKEMKAISANKKK